MHYLIFEMPLPPSPTYHNKSKKNLHYQRNRNWINKLKIACNNKLTLEQAAVIAFFWVQNSNKLDFSNRK